MNSLRTLPSHVDVQVDAIEPTIVGDIKTMVAFAFTIHAIPTLGFAQQVGKTLLQYPGSNTAENILAALAFEHHGINAL